MHIPYINVGGAYIIKAGAFVNKAYINVGGASVKMDGVVMGGLLLMRAGLIFLRDYMGFY